MERFTEVEALLQLGVQWLRLAVEAVGALVVALGVAFAAYQFLRGFTQGRTHGYLDLRLVLARYLVVALEFQLAGDILSTAIAPTWQRIGMLAAVAVIRTGLNYFLTREMESERARADASSGSGAGPAPESG